MTILVDLMSPVRWVIIAWTIVWILLILVMTNIQNDSGFKVVSVAGGILLMAMIVWEVVKDRFEGVSLSGD